MKHSVKLAVLTLTLSLVATSMFAAGSIATPAGANNVTASVAGKCQFTTPFAMPFGAYDPFSATGLTQTATIVFKCVKRTNPTDIYQIYFDKAAGNMTTVSSATDKLAYTLTASGGGALPVGSVAAVTVTGTPGVAGAGYSYTVAGAVAAGQDVGVGSYQDTVIVTVQY